MPNPEENKPQEQPAITIPEEKIDQPAVNKPEQPDMTESVKRAIADALNKQPQQNGQDWKPAFSRLEKMIALSGQTDILDREIVTDLLMKGWTLESLREKKPYLFEKKETPETPAVPATPPKPSRIVAPTKLPEKTEIPEASQTDFVKDLVNVLKLESF